MSTTELGLSAREHQRKEEILAQPEPTKIARTVNGAVLLKHGPLFLLTDPDGDMPLDGAHGLGLYYCDCRFLSGWTLTLNGRPLTLLSYAADLGLEATHHLVNGETPAAADMPGLQKNTILVRRRRSVEGMAVHEEIRLRNHGSERAELVLGIELRAKFEDVFVLRRFVEDRGEPLPPVSNGIDRTRLRYRGLDDRLRSTQLTFSPRPSSLEPTYVAYRCSLDPRGSTTIRIQIRPEVGDEPRSAAVAAAATTARATRRKAAAEDSWLSTCSEMVSSLPAFDRAMRRALVDLKTLRSRHGKHHYVAAGVPWFATLFGRDAAITAIQMLPIRHDVARDSLQLLAELQARHGDEFRDAEPGKILHELRSGELASAGRIPQSPAYYGTVDATALFLILAARYLRWSGDEALLRDLADELEAALVWLERHADHDGDGYVDYAGKYETGLVNQGWKDAGNALVRADGSFPEPPIALSEVQGYTYMALREVHDALAAVGIGTAGVLDDARLLREHFARDFWDERLGCYVLALERGKRPLDVATSNAGQVLWSGIAQPDRAARVAERLMRDDMFSGWGVRTLSTEARAYNPVGYHTGSVWPHDNAIILAGLRRYGHDREALRIFDALAQAAMNARDGRLPELFSGLPREPEDERPVDYPNACRPQAWAAGALQQALAALLGLNPDAPHRRLGIVRPVLPEWLERLELRRVPVGGARVDLRFARRGERRVDVDAQVRDGELSVEVREDLGPDDLAL